MKLFCAFLLALVITTKSSSVGNEGDSSEQDDGLPGREALNNFPLIDGHNDLAWNLRRLVRNQLDKFDFSKNLIDDPSWGKVACNTCFTDLPRLRAGKVGGQFWVAFGSCETQYKDAVQVALDQIDVIKNLIRKYHNDLEFVDSSVGILRAIKRKKIASLIAVEGGHLIDSRMSVLRMFYELGVRYLTLTQTCNTPWSDASPIDETDEYRKNLTAFGKKIILEMNRLGMMVDLSHVSYGVMFQALNISRAPVIFSHSAAYSVYAHHRNVQDNILKRMKNNGGIVMVPFYTGFISNGSANVDSVVGMYFKVIVFKKGAGAALSSYKNLFFKKQSIKLQGLQPEIGVVI
ncbi:dipeptidase 1-like [Agrilus planipennis]|uniref:Dipeptidase n=1 Tax=Agrilus planipennis TaxID=224129 RepID=A0A7F5RN41_AGRPL|nr:dipeptidase 1-like [Agrilus planipennis]XP_025837246.1 dipeptidase 1-like [Agrilus planipennis]